MYPGVNTRSIRVNDFMVAADGGRGELTQRLVDEGALVDDPCGSCDVTQQVQVLGRRFAEAAKHFVAEGDHLDS